MMSETARTITPAAGAAEHREFVRELGPLDSTMIVIGSMIGSGIFIVSADITRLVGSPGGLLAVWIVTGVLTVTAALSYGELAAMMPRAGGQYVYLREAYSPMWGFLYGWTLFLVIQTGTIAAVGVAFARFLGLLIPWISPSVWIVQPINISSGYAISLSSQQLIGVASILFLSALNTRGLHIGKIIQNVFTSAKTLSLFGLIVVGILLGRSAGAISDNFSNFWTVRSADPIRPDFFPVAEVAAGAGFIGMLVAFCVAQVGSLFSADAWNNITFTAGEVKNPQRDIPLSLALGTGIVITLYTLANVAYLVMLPLAQIQHAPDDRVATAALQNIFGPAAAIIMAVLIIISTFGCNNGLILAGARVYYAMSRDALFFKSTGRLNDKLVPAVGLILQGLWAAFLVLPRTRLYDAAGAPRLDPATGMQQYGNLYSDLLNYVVFSVLIFYVLTIAGIFILRRKRPDAPRPYRAFGYPVVPLLYIVAASTIMLVLILYRTQTTWPGLLIVLLGIPVYYFWHHKETKSS
ncbi:MAG TPA: amino acid permease [Candidatus Acidoferrales bacterium]|jgi:APA family basic amino acid/polyamine antiporter|nr:amino acid permease [Candidatus Acidoferrales bacterium]